MSNIFRLLGTFIGYNSGNSVPFQPVECGPKGLCTHDWWADFWRQGCCYEYWRIFVVLLLLLQFAVTVWTVCATDHYSNSFALSHSGSPPSAKEQLRISASQLFTNKSMNKTACFYIVLCKIKGNVKNSFHIKTPKFSYIPLGWRNW